MFSAERTRSFHLLVELVRRDFRGRFVGSALGLAWAVIQPVSFVALYWFVFTLMIPRSPDAATADYPLFLISGLLPWIGFQEGLVRGTSSIVDNAQMVRRIMFRSEVLAVVPNVSAILFELIGLGCFIIYCAVSGRGSLSGLWLLPVAVSLQLLLQIGLSWLLATIHVFFRDVSHMLIFSLTFAFYLSPILYSAEGPWEAWFFWNPMTPLLGLFRSALTGAPLPGAISIVYQLITTGALLAGGSVVFRRIQPSFADLL